MFRLCFALLALGLLLAPAAPANTAEPRKRALLIGINDYRANDPGQATNAGESWIPEDLQGALNDIDLMQKVLSTRFGFEPGNIFRLQDQEATREAVLHALDRFVAETGPDDIVYIHFSGHGSQVEDLNGDEPDGLDETILPHDARTGDVPDITDDELQAIFDRLPSDNSLVVLDSCHSGTATRGSSALRARAVGLDPRGQIYSDRAEPPAPASPPLSNYILMTGAADYQSALDGPLDEGRYYGLFTLSLGRSLGRLPTGSSALELHAEARAEMARIGAEFGLFAVPEAQLEGHDQRLAQGVLGTSRQLARRDAARLPWVSTRLTPDGRVLLEGAVSLAARVGSIWAAYPPGETAFTPGQGRVLIVEAQAGDDLLAKPEGGVEAPAAGSRAILLLEAPTDDRVPFRLDRMVADDRAALGAILARNADIRLVEGDGFARFLVDREGEQFAVYGAGGLQRVAVFEAAGFPGSVADRLRSLAQQSRRVNEILSLDNSASALHVQARVNPMDADGNVRGVAVVGAAVAPAYRVRHPGAPRDRSNSLQLEITASQDAWLTIVDVDPAGAVAILFPNGISERNGFLPDGFVAGGTPVRIPDSLGPNRAGFHWDYVPPTGVDTLRVFAASDAETARRIRAHISGVAGTTIQRGGQNRPSRLELVRPAPGLSTRGVAVVPDSSARPRHDWTATTVTVVVQE